MIKLKSLILESVTISVAGAAGEYPELHTIMDIGFELGRSVVWPVLEKELTPQEKERFRKSGVGAEVIAPDGSDFDKPTGIINFYIAGIPNVFVEKILTGIKNRLDTLGMEYEPFRGPEQSKMYKSLVYRIPIIRNPMEKSERVPELNMANSSFDLVFKTILKIVGKDDYGFSFPVETIEKAIEPFIKGSDVDQMNKLKPYTYDPKTITPEPAEPGDEWKDEYPQDRIMRQLGGTHYISGMDLERLSRYIAELNNIVKWAKAHGYKKIVGG